MVPRYAAESSNAILVRSGTSTEADFPLHAESSRTQATMAVRLPATGAHLSHGFESVRRAHVNRFAWISVLESSVGVFIRWRVMPRRF